MNNMSYGHLLSVKSNIVMEHRYNNNDWETDGT